MPIPPRRDVVAGLAITLLALLAHLATAPPAHPDPVPAAYRAPVDAPVTDPFRAPATPYGPGHRGIEYGTPPGATVAAAADGRVVFAGMVAGTLYVTVRHADGLRTTVGPLATLRVAAGQPVRAGQSLGTAFGALLFTVRRGDDYIDPASVLGAGPPEVHLIPERSAPARGRPTRPGVTAELPAAWLAAPALSPQDAAAILVGEAVRAVVGSLVAP
jgi:murein DD-endopeptidase MepM/ murein hydrolase activator NlpD